MYLERINSPEDVKKLSFDELKALSAEIRKEIIDTVSKTGGHLAPNLGAVELTLALHYSLNSPEDKIVWDVGHQCYTHKLITGRKEKFNTLRQYKGISGFPKRDESPHDAFDTGHASTSLSVALGLAKARDIKKENNHVVAVIGDGALTGGLALEGLNQTGYLNSKLIILMNDNKMSISPNVGALSQYTHRVTRTETFQKIQEDIKELLNSANGAKQAAERLKSHLKIVGSPGLLFEKLGVNYIGPIDGHNIVEIIDAIEKAKKYTGPVLIHALTEKGFGYTPATGNQPSFHGTGPFNIANGERFKCAGAKSYTEIFGNTIIKLAKENPDIVGITAAMPDGTGLSKFAQEFPDRFFDVGIAEGHAVTFAAGLAVSGLRPVVAIYSSFLQRAYDHIIHDVALTKLPVVFCVDRAGLVGDDGPTHHGVFDLSFLTTIPNMIVMAPKDENELQHMMKTALEQDFPTAIRYPRGCGTGAKLEEPKSIDVGKAEFLEKGDDIVIIGIGNTVALAKEASEMLKKENINATVINTRFAKPLDSAIAEEILRVKKAVIVEENTEKGGLGSAIIKELNGKEAQINHISIPDEFVEQGSQSQLRDDCGISSKNIYEKAKELVK